MLSCLASVQYWGLTAFTESSFLACCTMLRSHSIHSVVMSDPLYNTRVLQHSQCRYVWPAMQYWGLTAFTVSSCLTRCTILESYSIHSVDMSGLLCNTGVLQHSQCHRVWPAVQYCGLTVFQVSCLACCTILGSYSIHSVVMSCLLYNTRVLQHSVL